LDLEVLLFVACGRSSRSVASLAILKFCRSVARSVARLAWRVTAFVELAGERGPAAIGAARI